MQPESGKHRLSPPECVLHGPKTDLEVAQAALPVGIDHPPQALLDHLKAFGNQEERGGGDHQHQALQTRGIPQAGCFQTKEPAFVIQEAFLDLKSLSILRERLHAVGLIADDLPLFRAVCGTTQHDVDGAESMTGEGDVVEAAGFPGSQLDLIHLAETLTQGVSEDQGGLDANAVVPRTGPEPVHQIHVAEAPIGQQTNIPNPQEDEHPESPGSRACP